MKVRIGISLGPAAVPAVFGDAGDRVEVLGVDSLWLSEMVFGSLVEPFAGMAYALSRTARLKAGTGVAVLPGRHPVLVAKHLVSLAGLAPGARAACLRPAARPGRRAGAVRGPAGGRAAVFDESLRLIRLLLTQESVSVHGEFFTVEDAHMGPLPTKPLDIWLGGSAPGAAPHLAAATLARPGRRMMVAMKAPRAAARRHLPGSPFKAPAPAPPAETFAAGDQVTHDKYGLGVILGVEDHAVLVDFRPDQRRIPLPCAKLTKL